MYKTLYFAAGVVIGSVATYFAVKTRFEKQAQEDINEMREEYKKTVSDAIVDAVENLNEISEKKAEDELFREYDPNKTNYSGFSKKASGDEDGDPGEGTKAPVNPDLPYVITSDQFVYEMTYYDKISLLYYMDGVLVSDEETEVNRDLVGAENLAMMEGDLMYIRNDRVSTDYEIIRQSCEWHDIETVDDGS